MMRAAGVISILGLVNRILVAAANHVRKGLVAIVRRTLVIIPEVDGLRRTASESQ